MQLDTPVQYLKNVGPRTAERFARLGIRTVADLLAHYPRRYIDYSNAGGVAVSGLEMTQNSMRVYWTREEVDQYLQRIMTSIHTNCLEAAAQYGMPGDYMAGANIFGFKKVADAMIDQGLV